MTFPATAMQATHIPNGEFRFTTPDSVIRYQIYTVRSGRWAGRRVLKFHSDENAFRNNYAAFAFLNVDGSYTLWSKFEDREDSFLLYAADFLSILTDAIPVVLGLSVRATGGLDIFVESLNCCVCNGETDASDHFCREHWPFQVEEVLAVQESSEPSHLPRCEVTGTEVQ